MAHQGGVTILAIVVNAPPGALFRRTPFSGCAPLCNVAIIALYIRSNDWRGVLKDVGWPIKASVGLVLLSGLFALVAPRVRLCPGRTACTVGMALGCAPNGHGERMAAVVHPVAMEESDCQRDSPDSVGAVFDVSHFGPNPSETPERARACESIPCATTQDEPPHLIVP